MFLDYLRFIIGAAFILIGLITLILAIIGVNRLNYALNRMHAAATCDTLSMLFILVGLVIIEGITAATLKLVLIVVFFWITSPVCTHLIAKMERDTNKNIKDECEEMTL